MRSAPPHTMSECQDRRYPINLQTGTEPQTTFVNHHLVYNGTLAYFVIIRRRVTLAVESCQGNLGSETEIVWYISRYGYTALYSCSIH
jgi:hypothetical protein